MNRNPVIALTCLAVALMIASVAEPAPEVGDPAPAFELPGSDGETYKLADFKGRQVVILAWFPKAFTGG